MSEKLHAAIEGIDALHSDDPERVEHEGGELAKELLYARRMSSALATRVAEPSEALQIAVRAQHLCRWRLARKDFPEGRAGYKKWRTTLAAMHADLCAGVLRDVGYDDEFVDRVSGIIKKRGLRTSPETQALEDCACLVFLEYELMGFAAKHPDDKTISILRKTWGKMSDEGQRLALALDLSAPARALVEAALA